MEAVGYENCYVSEITIAELKFGAEKSEQVERNRKYISEFQEKFQILPIFRTLDFYAAEKARLRKAGAMLDDFDLLIGATAVVYNLVMVTNNTKHFSRISHIQLEDWARDTA